VFPSSWARAVPKVPKVIATATRLTNAHPKSEESIIDFINLVLIVVSSFFVNFNVFIFFLSPLFGWFLWVSQVKAFFKRSGNSWPSFRAAFCRSLLGSSICLHLFTQGLGAPSFSSLKRIFRDTSVQYHRQTEMLRRKQQPVIVGIALSSSAGVCRFWLKYDNPEIVLLPAPPHHLKFDDC
jgi:hypothetical protein